MEIHINININMNRNMIQLNPLFQQQMMALSQNKQKI